MKKLILTILASYFILSWSTNSANDDSNNSSSNGLLVKTITYSGGSTSTFNYNGNKLVNLVNSDGTTTVFTYNGDLIIKNENANGFDISNYSNNLLVSRASNYSFGSQSSTNNTTYTYNSNGSIITDITTGNSTYLGNTTTFTNKTIRYYSQGNCIKDERYRISNNSFILTETTDYTYDNKNCPYKKITGFLAMITPSGYAVNNPVSITHKNASGIISSISQFTYQYNSQDYPISATNTSTVYNISTSGTSSSPGTPSESTTTYTYY